ncbi:MAG TPA: Gmad2 immunoglobulin-like domain-containing protein [Acidimicrobiales bacterium]|nr:Gmad2 immunoglobulin-like domain-containing protein [Acidimicrobiales bacterium]
MTTEDRLRAAMRDRASSVDPAPDGLQQIKEKLMDAERVTTRNRVLLGIGAAAAAAAVVVAALAIANDDDDSINTVASTTTTTADGTTTPDDATTTSVAPAVDRSVPVFPDPATSRRFDDPQAVTVAFARDLLGFAEPIVGEFQAGDNRSGEVELRAFAQSTPTIVLVRQLEDDTWFVLGASVESIRLDSPEAGATITSPEALRGAAFAFEGHVGVKLYADGIAEPIAETYVTGRGDEMGPFAGELTFDVPDGVRDGVLVLFEASAKDGTTIRATVIRVHF